MHAGNAGHLHWLTVLAAVTALHVLAWQAYLHHDTVSRHPSPVVEVVLVAPPVRPPAQKPVHDMPKMMRRSVSAPLTQADEDRNEDIHETTPHPVTPEQGAGHEETPAVAAQPQASAPLPTVTAPMTAAVHGDAAPIEPPRYQAAYLSNPAPAYPLAARRRGQEGRVIVAAEVAADGSCLRAHIRISSGHDILDQAALQAVMRWRFVPARRGSQNVAGWVEIPLTFQLQNK